MSVAEEIVVFDATDDYKTCLNIDCRAVLPLSWTLCPRCHRVNYN